MEVRKNYRLTVIMSTVKIFAYLELYTFPISSVYKSEEW